MAFGITTISLIFVEAALVWAALVDKQRYCIAVFAVGVCILVLWILSLRFQISFPYQKLGLNIHLVLILGLGISVAGTIGIIVRVAK